MEPALVEQSPAEENKIIIAYGDLIELTSTIGSAINIKQYFVNYINREKISLVDENDSVLVLLVDANGNISNSGITGITILSRTESPSYAIQNKLVQDVWIDIYFGASSFYIYFKTSGKQIFCLVWKIFF